MMKMQVIGVMSGTSMDGVDLACCEFTEDNGHYTYRLLASETVPYEERWRLRLSKLNRQEPQIFWKTHVYYGKFLGQLVNEFVKKNQLSPQLVASHGHTVFHMPGEGYTCQIGDGASISATCGLPVVCDFRSTDVALGGHGAPLVPVGDQILFPDYNYCLNLGGIANISGAANGQFLAFDICPCNIGLNRVARNMGKLYDEGGVIAQSGQVNDELLSILNKVDYYKKFGPKSLSREWINTDFWHLTKDFQLSNEDKARTLVEHIAIQISKSLYHYMDGEEEKLEQQKMLVTGGGANNTFLMERIKTETPVQIVIPDADTVNFKEAIIFALLGMMRVQGKKNILSSVTGANADSISGALYGTVNI